MAPELHRGEVIKLVLDESCLGKDAVHVFISETRSVSNDMVVFLCENNTAICSLHDVSYEEGTSRLEVGSQCAGHPFNVFEVMV